jgi:hypothetical protein
MKYKMVRGFVCIDGSPSQKEVGSDQIESVLFLLTFLLVLEVLGLIWTNCLHTSQQKQNILDSIWLSYYIVLRLRGGGGGL